MSLTKSVRDDVPWDSVRDEIKAALDKVHVINMQTARLTAVLKNIAVFLNQKHVPGPPPPSTRQTTSSGGFKMPPFPKRTDQSGGYRVPASIITAEEAEEFKTSLFTLLEEFDAYAFH
jgi:serine/threonine-protein phosphatase 4 regulatory subunit 2